MLQGLQQGSQQGLQQGFQQGFQQGSQQGSQQAKLETAKKMLKDGKLSIKEIAEITDLPIEEINKFKK